MKVTVPFGVFLAAALLTACAIHPLPEDFSAVTTDVIVKQIRCETREAARSLILDEFSHSANSSNPELAKIAKDLLAAYDGDQNRERISEFDPNKSFSNFANTRHYLDLIYETGVAYNFDLTMSEKNDLSGEVDFLGVFNPKFVSALKGDFNHDRSNERTFTVTDTIGKLLKGLSKQRGGEHYCQGRLVTENYIYPITGRIGVDKTLRQFFQVAIFDDLKTSSTSAPWADKLTFTTTVDISANPSISFTPLKSGSQISGASLGPSLSRTDTHQVTLGVALPTSVANDLGELTSFVFSQPRVINAGAQRLKARSMIGQTILATPTNDAEAWAARAVDQLKSREVILVPAP